MTDERQHPEGSLHGRLHARYGDSFDPWITLEEERPFAWPSSPASRRAEPEASAARPPSSGLIDRLRTRPLGGGRYRVDGELGRGGMGAILDVWDEDLRRHLAMKVALGGASSGTDATPASGALDPRVLARFLEEAQVTGQLEHPGIVPVHELGMDEDGQVFFTMRRVQGRDLEHVFGQVSRGDDGWTTTRAIGVLNKVCDAMAYAHSRGVVHRDLKPANVMVGRFGEVYVMDWGLVRVRGQDDRHDVRVDAAADGDARGVQTDARADGSGRSGDALYTMDGDVLGTPAYMPPEQARGELQALDARSDVYALGAMLYRLLAGVAPYADDTSRRGARALLEALRAGPPTPLAQLAPAAPPELVAITEKAMSRDASARYADMSELREDLSAFLEQRVVGAYETGAVAEARKWVRRNRPLAASLAAGLLVLVGGLAFSLVQKQRADDNAAEAQTAAALAEERRVLAAEAAADSARSAEEARASAALAEQRRLDADAAALEAARQSRVAQEVNDFLNRDLLAAVDPEKQGVDVTVREVLHEAGARLQGRFPDEPLVEAELRSTLGNSFSTLGLLDEALPHVRRALALRREHLGADDPATLAVAVGTAQVLTDMAEYEEALALFDDTLTRMRAVHGPTHPETLDAQRQQAVAFSHDGDLQRAAEILEAVREFEDPNSLEALVTATNLGMTLSSLGRLEEAEVELQRSLERNLALRGPQHLETLTAMSNLSVLYVDLGRYDEAWELEHDSYLGRVALLGTEHQNVGQSLVNLGVVERHQHRFAEAERHILQGIAILRGALSEEHDRVLLAVSNLSTVLGDQRRHDEQIALMRANTETLRRVHGDEHPTTMLSMGNLAILLLQLGRVQESKVAHEEILEIERRVRGSDHPRTLVTIENYGNVLYTLQDYEGAIRCVEEVLDARTRVLGADHPDVAKTWLNLGMVCRYSGRADRALEAFRASVATFDGSVGVQHYEGTTALRQLADLTRDSGDKPGALPIYARALEAQRALDPDDLWIGYLLHQASITHLDLDELDDALARAEESLEFRRAHVGEDSDQTLTTKYLLSGIYRRLARWDEAEAMALDFHDRALATLGAEHGHVRLGREALVKIYSEQGKTEQADAWR